MNTHTGDCTAALAPAGGRPLQTGLMLLASLLLGLTLVLVYRPVAQVDAIWLPLCLLAGLAGGLLLLRREQLRSAAEQARCRAVAEAAADWVWECDAELRFTAVSENFYRITGCPRGYAIGKTRWEVAGIDPDTDPVWGAHRDLLLRREPYRDFVYSNTDQRGRRRAWKLSAKPVFDRSGRFTGYIGTGSDVTAEWQARERARDVESLLLGITANMPGIIFRCVQSADGELRYPYISEGCRDLLGYRVEELQTAPHALFRAVHADDAAMVHAAMEESIRSLTPLSMEYRIVTRGGDYCWVRDVSRPRRQPNGEVIWDGLLLDISERVRADQALRDSDQRFRAIMDNLPAGISLKYPDGRYFFVSEFMCRQFGLRAAQALGQTPEDIFPAEYARRGLQQDRLVLLEGKPVAREEEIEQGGERRWLLTTKFPVLSVAGEVVAIGGIHLDITERKALESQLLQAQKLESIGELAAGIAHEINTPTQYVGDNLRFLQESFADLMALETQRAAVLAQLRELHPEADSLREHERAAAAIDLEFLLTEIQPAIEQSISGTDQIAHIVRAMKAFSHPGTAERALADLNDLVRNTAVVARNEWKYIADLQFELAEDLPAVPCFVAELNQVLLNLIVNAAHAIEDAYREQPDATGLIVIGTRQVNGGVELSVSDTGSGIPEQVRHRVFDPFFTTKPVGRGSGQGLAIARSVVVEKHGGTLTFDSTPGQGSCFRVFLPMDAKDGES